MQGGAQRSADDLYEQNQRLGYRINYLNDENNFYRISINNIKKLSQNINKRLATNGRAANPRGSAQVQPKRIAEAYTSVTSQIQLKNLQMRVGTMKRRVDKMQKLHEGSISSLLKQAQQLQRDVNVLGREYEYYTIQGEFLDNIYLDDYLISRITEEGRGSACRGSLGLERNARRGKTVGDRAGQLEEQELRLANRLEQMGKEEKELRERRSVLMDRVSVLKEERERLAGQVYPRGFNIRIAQAAEINSLKLFSKKEEELLEEIAKQDLLLEQQYKTNQEYKQKILDRNELQMKDIKILQDKIKKRNEELKEIKQKCETLQNNKNKSTVNAK